MYDFLRSDAPADDPRRLVAAQASPLSLAIHLDPTIVPYDHASFLDDHVTALCNLHLYPDGPGPAPEVFIRHTEGQGIFHRLPAADGGPGGYEQAVSDEAFEADELVLIRPGIIPGDRAEEAIISAVPEEHRVTLKLAIAMPPRHGKSTIVTEFLPLWFMLRYPTNSAVVATYNQEFADEWGKNLQDRMPDFMPRLPLASDGLPLYSPGAPGNLLTMRQASFRPGKDRGVINFRGAGKSLTGTGWGLGINDDPFKDQSEALSPAERKNKKNWYSSVFSNRRTRRRGCPPPIEIMMFTRWHEDDLAGAFAYAADGETPAPGWCVLRLPALAEQNDPLGRPVGASLCPALAPLDFLLAEQEKDPTWFSCLFQGRPTHEQGGVIAKTHEHEDGTHTYHHYRMSSDGDAYVPVPGAGNTKGAALPVPDGMPFITMDLAASKKTTADYTVASLWQWFTETNTLVLVDRKRERVSTEDHKAWLVDFLTQLPNDVEPQFIGIENKTFGTNLINELRASMPELVIIPIPSDADKITKNTPYANAVKTGKVWFPHPDTWPSSVTWENEHAKFPNSTHDDQVDTGGMAWTQAQKYSYTPTRKEEKPSTARDRAARQLRRKQGNQHDYHRLSELI